MQKDFPGWHRQKAQLHAQHQQARGHNLAKADSYRAHRRLRPSTLMKKLFRMAKSIKVLGDKFAGRQVPPSLWSPLHYPARNSDS
jgi:hypothetical protein